VYNGNCPKIISIKFTAQLSLQFDNLFLKFTSSTPIQDFLFPFYWFACSLFTRQFYSHQNIATPDNLQAISQGIKGYPTKSLPPGLIGESVS
jgi:hypothetical protein